MRQPKIPWMIVALILLPVQVLAAPAVCLSDQLGNLHLLEVLGTSGFGFMSVVGAVIFSPGFNDTTSCPLAPLAGTAFVLPDGSVELGYTTFASTSACLPIVVHASLSATTGILTASLDEVNSGFFTPLALTLAPGQCGGLPALSTGAKR